MPRLPFRMMGGRRAHLHRTFTRPRQLLHPFAAPPLKTDRMTEPMPRYPITEDTSGLQRPGSSLRSGTEVSTLAVLLVLVSWLAVLGTWNFGPVNQLPPEQDIEPGEAFGLGFFLLLPFYAASLVALPALLVALVGWLPRLITGGVSPVLVLFGLWINSEENASLHRVFPTLETVAALAVWAGGIALVLVVVEAIHLATPAGRRSWDAAGRAPRPRL
ncbi:hypothetical protein IEQ44_04690 [Nocardioides sp. Y6]|uniref:Uncharacterized protein n=1 Tax=Nocardioides malaquae TaxID=2773426 RepID=A0ABR9RQV4_9ACTN|nr:hypothetical protein [Nocardioides malaquae]MBE7323946.1 hypothetical protein [Nocardioides malaquae]